MQGFGRTIGTIGILGAALAALLLVPGLVATASGAPALGPAGTSQQWAYGGQKWVNVTEDFGNATYSAHAFFGWNVIFTATNTSATTVELEAQRTMSGSYYASLCAPSCTAPIASGNLSLTAWEKDTGFANLTTSATVYEHGNATPAVGLLNASARASGNISETMWLSMHHMNTTWTASTGLFVSGSADSSISFGPALGLVPYNATTGTTWNSTSDFNASGAWSANANWYRTSVLGARTSGSYNPSGTVQGNGSVSLSGADLGMITLRNGATVPVIALTWTGPFDDVDGVILIPHDFDLFGNGGHDWSAAELGVTHVATSNLDLAVDSFHHVHLAASATSFDSSDASLATAGTRTAGPSPAAVSTPSTVVQGQPESVSQARQGSSCLVGSCAQGPSAAAAPFGLVLVIGLVVAVVVGSVSVIEYRLWTRRRAERGLVGTPSPVRPVAPSYSNSGASMAPPPPPAAAKTIPKEPPQTL